MCGIAGIYYRDGERLPEPAVLDAMARIQSHRGPDGQGVFSDGAIGLSFRRLAIVDLETGDQPMTSVDGDRVLVFNGEIYNHVELRAELEARGARFRTRSDTEVILEAFGIWGEACVERFNGMFAFALWQRSARRLFLARDRIGIKPLYIAEIPGGVAFASEMKAFYQIPEFEPRLDPEALDEYFTLGYATTPRTLLANVRKAREGNTITWTAGGARERPYWDLPLDAADPPPSFAAASDQVRELLEDAVRLRLRADVPLGVFLSGGVDSSLVTMLTARMRGNEAVKTFSIGFDHGPDYNELQHARRVAALAQTRAREAILSPTDFLEFIPRFVWHMDEPVTEGAALPLYAIARLAREDVTVILSGEGADELFGGYPTYGVMLAIERWRRLPGLLRTPIEASARRLLASRPRAERVLDLLARPLQERYTGAHVYDLRQRAQAYHPDFLEQATTYDPLATIRSLYERSHGLHPLRRMLHLDFKTWLPNDILIKADRMSMAASLELRVPFLDHRLVELSTRIPPAWLTDARRRTKRVLKDAAVRSGLPHDLVHRSKMGFPTPLASLFKGALRDFVGDRLHSDRVRERGILDSDLCCSLYKQHIAGEGDHHKLIWRAVVLEEWLRTFLDERGARVRELSSAG